MCAFIVLPPHTCLFFVVLIWTLFLFLYQEVMINFRIRLANLMVLFGCTWPRYGQSSSFQFQFAFGLRIFDHFHPKTVVKWSSRWVSFDLYSWKLKKVKSQYHYSTIIFNLILKTGSSPVESCLVCWPRTVIFLFLVWSPRTKITVTLVPKSAIVVLGVHIEVPTLLSWVAILKSVIPASWGALFPSPLFVLYFQNVSSVAPPLP